MREVAAYVRFEDHRRSGTMAPAADRPAPPGDGRLDDRGRTPGHLGSRWKPAAPEHRLPPANGVSSVEKTRRRWPTPSDAWPDGWKNLAGQLTVPCRGGGEGVGVPLSTGASSPTSSGRCPPQAGGRARGADLEPSDLPLSSVSRWRARQLPASGERAPASRLGASSPTQVGVVPAAGGRRAMGRPFGAHRRSSPLIAVLRPLILALGAGLRDASGPISPGAYTFSIGSCPCQGGGGGGPWSWHYGAHLLARVPEEEFVTNGRRGSASDLDAGFPPDDPETVALKRAVRSAAKGAPRRGACAGRCGRGRGDPRSGPGSGRSPPLETVVSAFLPFGEEIDTIPLLSALHGRGCVTCAPVSPEDRRSAELPPLVAGGCPW